MKSKNINFAIDPDSLKKLGKIKKSNKGQTITGLINITIGEWLRTQKIFLK